MDLAVKWGLRRRWAQSWTVGLLTIWNDVWSFASMECVQSWSSGIFRRWIWRWAMGSSLVWGDIQSFAMTEYVWSCDSRIFRSWWPKVVPYSIPPLMLVVRPVSSGHLVMVILHLNLAMQNHQEKKGKKTWCILAVHTIGFLLFLLISIYLFCRKTADHQHPWTLKQWVLECWPTAIQIILDNKILVYNYCNIHVQKPPCPQHRCRLGEGYQTPTCTCTCMHPWHLPTQVCKPVIFPIGYGFLGTQVL